MKMGLYQEAAENFWKAVETKPESAVAHFALVVAVKLEKSKESTAINRLTSKLHMTNSNLTLLNQLALLNFFEVKDSQARTMLSKALCIDEEFVPALISLAEVLSLTGED